MDFGARTARARFAHHPEIVLFAALFNVHFGVEPVLFEDVDPVAVRLRVELGGFALGGLVNRCVEAFLGELPDIDQKLPRPVYRLFFEVVAKRPVAEHFEKRMVVRIETHVFKVVVFAARAYAFLRVGGAQKRIFFLAQKVGDKLVHPRVCEEQIGRCRHQRRRRNYRVPLRLEKFQKTFSNFCGFHKKSKNIRVCQ